MNKRHLPAAATALLAAAVIALTACGPSEAKPEAVPTATAVASGAPGAAPAPASAASAKPVPVSSASKGAPKAPKASAPVADCQADAAQVGHVIEAAEVGYATHVWMKAKETRFVCGPDLPGASHFEATGAVKVFEFTNEVRTYVLADLKEKPFPLNDFMARAEACLTDRSAVQRPYGCYGNQFAVKVDAAGRISEIHQLYRP
ncbi:hypothetical protein [Kitasatospora sp. NPDC002040]|uniref:hypothetical protein n=1 Tax=Kitasatospora sp. NPDC002040 TaxID=3154661 RepID=UPI00333083BD